MAFALLSVGTPLLAQQQTEDPKAAAEQEKKLQEFINTSIETLESTLKLEDWQVFYVDSILNNDYRALQEELNTLTRAKVSNSDLYTQTSDKWAEQMYNSIHKVLNEDQWAKYLKTGAERAKKSRDKRKAKRELAAVNEND